MSAGRGRLLRTLYLDHTGSPIARRAVRGELAEQRRQAQAEDDAAVEAVKSAAEAERARHLLNLHDDE